MPDMPESPGGDPDLHVFSFSLVLLQERAEAVDLLADLLQHQPDYREACLRADPRFRTWGFVELLVVRSLEAATQDTEQAEELGRLALTVSSLLDPRFYGAEPIEDLRARAWSHIANARRVRSDLDGAERAFASSKEHLRRGTQDSLTIALLLDLEGSLRRDQRQLGEAARLFAKAAGIFLDQGDPHRCGRSFLKLSTVQYFAGDLEEAMATLRLSLERLDFEREPRLRLHAGHNLADYLTLAERFEEALAVYRETRSLYREFPEPWVENRRKWVRARILRGMGKPRLAESLLLAVRDGFLAEGVPFDTALVSLEIAALYAEQGRRGELKKLAGEIRGLRPSPPAPLPTARPDPRERGEWRRSMPALSVSASLARQTSARRFLEILAVLHRQSFVLTRGRPSMTLTSPAGRRRSQGMTRQHPVLGSRHPSRLSMNHPTAPAPTDPSTDLRLGRKAQIRSVGGSSPHPSSVKGPASPA
jgi:tetratricopeptide (TPR) repeat protein